MSFYNNDTRDITVDPMGHGLVVRHGLLIISSMILGTYRLIDIGGCDVSGINLCGTYLNGDIVMKHSVPLFRTESI